VIARHHWIYSLLLVGALAAPLVARAQVKVVTTEAEFRAAVSNPTADGFNEVVPLQSIKSPMMRAAGLYRYRVSAAPFGLYIGGLIDSAWLSVQEPPQSTLTVDAFRPAVRGVGAYVFGVNERHGMPGMPIKVTVKTAEESFSRTINDTNTMTFIGFVSARSPIQSIKFEAIQQGRIDAYPAVRTIVLGSAASATSP
jgi:hypothetical protein